MTFSQPSFKVKRSLDCMDMCHLFLNQFPPWEVEEIACIRDYIIGRYAQLFATYEHELVRLSPQGPPPPKTLLGTKCHLKVRLQITYHLSDPADLSARRDARTLRGTLHVARPTFPA